MMWTLEGDKSYNKNKKCHLLLNMYTHQKQHIWPCVLVSAMYRIHINKKGRLGNMKAWVVLVGRQKCYNNKSQVCSYFCLLASKMSQLKNAIICILTIFQIHISASSQMFRWMFTSDLVLHITEDCMTASGYYRDSFHIAFAFIFCLYSHPKWVTRSAFNHVEIIQTKNYRNHGTTSTSSTKHNILLYTNAAVMDARPNQHSTFRFYLPWLLWRLQI